MMDGMEEESASNEINLKILHLAENTSDVKTRTRDTVSMVHVQTQTQDTAALVDVETQTTTGALMMDVSVQTYPESSISTRKKRKDVRSLDMNFACDQCMAKFTNNSHLTRHLKSVHAPSSRIPCRKCGKTFKNQRSLTSHQKLARCKGNKKKNVPKKKDRIKIEKTPNTKTKPAKPRMKK
ncbi:unnamed protein product [Allacma fusca]|uniref:C2H2-type domain-containing protein n=1 Tax=Allacma fusca TaxID=39272 RepID=A0A8J2JLS6_9HEXA|nr:unnamed protein product [Allacma fusca]